MSLRMLGRVPESSFLSRPAPSAEGKAFRIFRAEGDFAALNEARQFLAAHGFSVGPEQRGAPIGVMLGDVTIAKWRNLDAEEREDLHGQLWTVDGSFRSGPVFLDIRDDCPASVFAALADPVAQSHVEGRK